MRALWIWVGTAAAMAVALVILVVVIVRHGDNAPPRSLYATRLASLCTAARTQIEGLGRANEEPIAKIYPGSVRIGRAFVKQVRTLEPPVGQKALATKLVTQFGLYYDGLNYGYQFLTAQKNQAAFIRIVNGALQNLDQAEAAAKALGVPECAVRPFE